MTTTALDLAAIKQQFPLLQREVNGAPLVYLDSANTSQKPSVVIDTMTAFLRNSYAPINRSAYQLASEATDAYEGARTKVQHFINARRVHEVVFTKNATEALNLVAHSWGRTNLREGDVVVLTHMEHHANIVPWHMLVAERGIVLRWVPLTADGQLDLTTLPQLLDGAKVFSFTAMSNVLGSITPVQQLCAAAHAAGALAIVDGCQYVPHNVTDVQAWGADFMAFSSHKMCGPSGVGVLYGREALLDAMPPFLGGGNMIADVRLDGFTTAELPAKFEAGTPPITEVVGLGAAVDFLTGLGMANIREHEIEIADYALRTLTERFGDDITLHGPTDTSVRGSTFSLAFRGIHPHDLSQVLDQKNVCVRAGHHCAKPLMRLLGVSATARASFYLYNDTDDVDTLADALDGASAIFGF
ncbi:MAG: SufS family cysteine desulfurase [Actinobacteria bacterium]|uniref:cysteine desulfurase n=1 Tax=freshwater metagenome TaxID=449393 RepID=A0A6J6A547_9ZZZZ|nr:SufS family cysteine desulfurase [Actinomycetota bacterium]MSW76263.1 SufS family cysteine desulfurase [Actinomycetota bacterium]MSX56510.1 SufS family cysteine desulfurase [Actinomycetota bacterium]MSX92171.1 SufS family cysteine desulfurase [Actinomycetota bacterium]MSZ81973.1 SufS family cysteine desulfurase [Actinomycetota bacterium]